MSIQRYEMEPDCTLEPMNADMRRSGIGDWVLYTDHLAALTAAEAERDAAIGMLAEWCVAVDENGTHWDDWDYNYKNAMYGPGPLRELLDAAIAAARGGEK